MGRNPKNNAPIPSNFRKKQGLKKQDLSVPFLCSKTITPYIPPTPPQRGKKRGLCNLWGKGLNGRIYLAFFRACGAIEGRLGGYKLIFHY